MKGKFLSLSLQDLLRGAAIAVGTSVLVTIEPILNMGTIPDIPTLKKTAIVGISAGIVYLFKNLFTNSKDQFGKPEPCPILEVKEEEKKETPAAQQ